MANSTLVATPFRRRAPELPVRLVHAAVLAAAIAIGVLAAIRPALALAGMLALALVPLILAKPIAGLCALAFLSFLEEYAAMTGAVSGTKILGGMLILAWLAIMTTAGSRDREATSLLSREPALSAALILFATWAVLSFAWSESAAAAENSIVRFILNFLLFPIALVAVRTPRHAMWLVAVVVAGSFAAVALGFLNGTMNAEEEARLKGAGLNPNQLGMYLVACAVLAGALVANRRWSPLGRAVVLGVAFFAGIALLMTLSRGALVGMAAALLVAPLVIGRGRRLGAVILATVAVVGTLGWYTAYAPEAAVDRIVNPEKEGGSGRVDLWRVGWRMVEDRPLHGVGAGNFPDAAVHYLLRPGATGNDTIIVDEKKVAHNVYLTVLSELGAVGLSLFLLILLLCLRSAIRAARNFERDGDLLMELVARGLFIALISLIVAGFFSSALYSKQLWLLLALAPALLAISQRSAATVTRLGQWRSAPTRAAD